MGTIAGGEIVFEFRSDKRGVSAEVQVFKVNVDKRLDQIATITVGDIRNLARIFEEAK